MIERQFIVQGLRKLTIKNFLKEQLVKAGFTDVEIVKTPLVTRIILHVTKPGLAIGKKGAAIKQLTKDLEKKFNIDNPQIQIEEIRKPELSAQAMADNMAGLIERGLPWRSVTYKTAKDIMAAGAQGVEIKLSGKLAGKSARKRRHRIVEGYMKKVGDQAKKVDYAKAAAYPSVGAIGIRIRIVPPGAEFQDKIKPTEYLAKHAPAPVEEPPATEEQPKAEGDAQWNQ